VLEPIRLGHADETLSLAEDHHRRLTALREPYGLRGLRSERLRRAQEGGSRVADVWVRVGRGERVSAST
jgi:hypothetical protein